ncbi:MAG: lactate utilization protein C [Prevotella sp.]
MNSKQDILSRLRHNVRETYDKPDLSFPKTVYDDPVAEFIRATTTTAGARLMEIAGGDDINQKIREAYPEAKVIATNIPGIDATLNPDTVAEAQDLERTDVGVVRGTVGVAENACVWIPQTMKERAVCFMAEYLVIIVSRRDIVSNMHEAYRKIEFTDYGFGTFISGPSKTADIEQSLVYGAQAARGVTVMLVP